MPELPEVETVCRGLRPKLEGQVLSRVLQRRPDLRFPLPPDFAARLQGRRVARIERRAKYILMHLDPAPERGTLGAEALVLLCHLGMSGRMTIMNGAPRELERHDHIVFYTAEGNEVRFNDARRFGMMDLIDPEALESHWLLRKLGPEPLSNAFNGPALAARLEGRRTPIKAALLDQKVVAGLGNIYVSEALFFAGLSPRRQAYTVQGARAERLAGAVRRVLTAAIEAGGSSLRDYVQADGELGYFQHQWAVYDRAGQPCPGCDCGALPEEASSQAAAGIRRIVQSNRATFFCPHRQK